MEEGISVMYTPYSGAPTAERINQAEEAFMKQNSAFTDFIYTGNMKLRDFHETEHIQMNHLLAGHVTKLSVSHQQITFPGSVSGKGVI